MQKIKQVLYMAAVVVLLTGCGKSVEEMTTIALQKDGTVEQTIIEAFDEESTDALQEMMLSKAAEYNQTVAGDGVSVNKVEKTGDGSVRVLMTYPSAEDFDGFMNMDVVAVNPELRAPFFYGTVEEAYEEGYNLDVQLLGVENENLLRGKEDLLLLGENKIIIYDSRMNLGAPVRISTQENLLYSSENVTVSGKKQVEVSDTDELAYILLEG